MSVPENRTIDCSLLCSLLTSCRFPSKRVQLISQTSEENELVACLGRKWTNGSFWHLLWRILKLLWILNFLLYEVIFLMYETNTSDELFCHLDFYVLLLFDLCSQPIQVVPTSKHLSFLLMPLKEIAPLHPVHRNTRTQSTSFCCSLSPHKPLIGTAQCLPLPTPYVKMRKPRHFIYSRNFQKSYSSKFGSPPSRAAYAILRDTMFLPRIEKESRGELSRDSKQSPRAKYTSCMHRGKASCEEVLLHCL
jgi:hypothetical protein